MIYKLILSKINITHVLTVVFISFFSFTQAQQEEQGNASYYANKFEGKTTASGEKYWHNKLTAAHKTLPFGTMVKVINLENNKEVTVRVNDRGPFVEDRIIDVSKSAAETLNFVDKGITEVRIIVISEEDIEENEKPENTEISKAEETQNIKNTETVTTTAATSETNNFYNIKSSKITVRGFGVQIASYQELGNLLEQCAIVEAELKQQTLVQIVNNGGTKIYRLIIGVFDTRSKAEYFKDSIKEKHSGFVVTF